MRRPAWSGGRPHASPWVGRVAAALLCGLCGLASMDGAVAQDGNPAHGPAGGMATRAVSTYLALERTLQQALAEHRRAVASGLLDTDFELRTPASRDAVTRDVWLAAEFKQSRPFGRVRDLSVFELDDVAIVSFLSEPPAGLAGKRGNVTHFIVDVWRQSSGKLQARYLDVPAHPPPGRERPDGRE